jgi:hypothetical protein
MTQNNTAKSGTNLLERAKSPDSAVERRRQRRGLLGKPFGERTSAHIGLPQPLPPDLPPAAPCSSPACIGWPTFWLDPHGRLHCERCDPPPAAIAGAVVRRRLFVWVNPGGERAWEDWEYLLGRGDLEAECLEWLLRTDGAA